MENLLLFISIFVIGGLSDGAVLKNQTFKTPEYIIPCYKSDPNLNKCIKGSFNHLRPYLIRGLKDIEVPTIDPFFIDRIIMENQQGAFRIRGVFSNVTATGASNYSIEAVKADVKNYHIELGISLPRIEVRGKYEIAGNIFFFPVRARGDFWAVFLDVDGSANLYGKEYKDKNNVRFMRIDRMSMDFNLKKSRFKARDTLNRGNVLGEAINQFLNTNSDEIIAEMKPAARVSIAKHFKNFLNSAFTKIPLQIWLPDA